MRLFLSAGHHFLSCYCSQFTPILGLRWFSHDDVLIGGSVRPNRDGISVRRKPYCVIAEESRSRSKRLNGSLGTVRAKGF
jgi:hypothetical protein